jgi:hypothetical protein
VYDLSYIKVQDNAIAGSDKQCYVYDADNVDDRIQFNLYSLAIEGIGRGQLTFKGKYSFSTKPIAWHGILALSVAVAICILYKIMKLYMLVFIIIR